jgi:amino acid adenylation domain-containing protein
MPEQEQIPVCVHEWLRRTAERFPHHTALVSRKKSFTFAEMDKAANQLAWRLTTSGVRPESTVALLADRSPELVATMLAVWKAGAAYVPLDPAYPAERLRFILEDAQVTVLLGTAALVSKLAPLRCPTITLGPENFFGRSDDPNLPSDPRQLAYVIYTSGSTGVPKGVAVEHRSLFNLSRWHQKVFSISEASRTTHIAGLGFDASVWELWPSLTAGAAIFMPEEQDRVNPEQLQQWLIKQQITTAFLPTPLAEKVLQLEWPPETSLRLLLTGGDKLHFAPQPGLPFQVVNNYGPTENTVVATSCTVPPSDEPCVPTIGTAIRNVSIYILDAELSPAVSGEPGEIWISGRSLARGYVYRPAATAERFFPDPFTAEPGLRMYRTGDLGRWLPNGEIEFLGRSDDQVKIRGFRVELGEIESVLLRHSHVSQAAVLVRGNASGNGRIVAYLAFAGEKSVSRSYLRDYLRSRLPDYMLPSAFVILPALPLNANGKIDRQALPEPGQADSAGDVPLVEPRTASERAVVRIWSELLENGHIGVLDNFFDLGGHSLLVTQMLTRIRNVLGVDLEFAQIFAAATVENVATLIDSARESARSRLPHVEPVPPEERVTLSFPQEQVWFLSQLVPGNLAYNTQVTVRFQGQLNVAVLEKCFTEIVRRHEIFRTSFAPIDGLPVQQVHPPFAVKVPVADLRLVPAAIRFAEAERLVSEELAINFDLSSYPLVRWKVLQLADDDFMLVQLEHHFVHDGWSLAVLMSELKALYAAFMRHEPSPLPELPVQYRDFARWQRKVLESGALAEQIEYWKQRLLPAAPLLTLPQDHPRPAVPGFRGKWHRIELPAELYGALKQLSRRQNATLFMVLLAAFKTLITRYTHETDIAIGSSIANRRVEEVEGLIGMVVNMLVLRTDVSGDPAFSEVVKRVREVVLGAHAHQDVPLHKLIHAVQPERDIGRNPLFQVTFGFHDSAMPDLDFPGLRGKILERSNGSAKFDLSVIVIPRAEQSAARRVHTDATISVIWEYNTELFDTQSIERMARHYVNLLEAVVEAPHRRIGDLNLLSSEEMRAAETRSQGPCLDLPELCFHELFERQARRTPHALAVLDPNTGFSYSELNERSQKLANYLVELGAKPEALVGVCLRRSAESVAAVLAIFKLGGAYLPIHYEHPAERIQFILNDARPLFVLAESETAHLFAGSEACVVLLKQPGREPYADASAASLAPVSPANLAYVIYTSGSTGNPKGVLVSHRGFSNLHHAHKEAFKLGEGDRVLQFASASFDASIFELALALLSGATLCLPREKDVVPGPQLTRLLQEWEVTTLTITPSALAALPSAEFPKLRNIIAAGEACSGELVAKWSGGRNFFNAYGPTETTIWATCEPCSPAEADPGIGRPITNMQVRVLDEQLRPVPVNIAGDLYIGGVALARGYLNLAAMTAEKFLPDPWGDGSRLYKTGDVARALADGRLQFLGRSDDQVKLRGFRIELGEIEATLARHPVVANAVAMVRKDQGLERLVAYVIGRERAMPAAEELKDYLRSKLPEYMVPWPIVYLESFPLTSSGKVDRKKLAHLAISFQTEKTALVPPASGIERTIAEIWAEVLHLDAVGANRNFFDLGGHSLLLVQVQQKIKQALNVEVSFVDLFRCPTVAALAEMLQTRVKQPEPAEAPGPARRSGRMEASGIAVIGMAGRFPGAHNVWELWTNLCAGQESISFFSEAEMAAVGVTAADWQNAHYVRARGVLEDAEMFDAAFFGFSPREADITDPQQRIFLECAWESLEDAGCDPEIYGGRIGVFAGSASSTYLLANLYPNRELVRSLGRFQTGIATDKDHVATRTSYKLDLTGPGVAIDTACSTSLVALHIACRALQWGDCEVALAGGVAIKFPQQVGYLYEKGGYSSPDGHCRAFDANAQGTLGGNGCAVVVLKRLQDALEDGDQVYAVIEGTAINNDGALKPGYTAPSVTGQVKVIRAALQAAAVEPETVGYVEAHGTGTPLGDPIEASALIEAYSRDRKAAQPCALGSIKTNIGHLDAAAGITGLLKTALCLREKKLVPSLHFKTPNPQIDFQNNRFYVNTQLCDWESNGHPRRGSVSSFGIGGTNAHAILEEPPAAKLEGQVRDYQLLVLSASTNTALEMATDNLAAHLEAAQPHPADVAFTLQTGRKRMQYRRALVCPTHESPVELLRQRTPAVVFTEADEVKERRVVLLFPGQGNQQIHMARDLYGSEAVFRDSFDACAAIVEKRLGFSLKELVYPSPQQEEASRARIAEVRYAQAAVFAIEYSLAQLWQHWGVRPHALAGHSLGEYVAACIAGVFSLEDALLLVSERGRLMQDLPRGAMLSVALACDEVRKYLGEGVDIGAVNSPSQCMISGTAAAVEELESRLMHEGVLCKRLPISAASHSPAMEPILESFARFARTRRFHPPTIPFLSNLTGTWITPQQATDPAYWVRHMRHTVRFLNNVEELLKEKDWVLLEVGPGKTLSNIVLRHPRSRGVRAVVATLFHPDKPCTDMECLLHAVGKLWLAGVRIDFENFWQGQRRRRVSLPTYPFERKRHWIAPPSEPERISATDNGANAFLLSSAQAEENQTVLEKKNVCATTGANGDAEGNELEQTIAGIWQGVLGVPKIGLHDNFFRLGGDSLIAIQVVSRIRQALGVSLSLRTLFETPTIAGLASTIVSSQLERV